ncbi:MAG: iron-sulfur cluster assembly protein [Candidatus Korarchaeota archaeon]|nr:iron-sulfur cluster assembly protein [Candidatus Korarchaeota archaeon]MDK2383901.1 iron-sulfur cluster assembly protein [Candidatus Korarchaeota archaeon]
MGTGLSGEEKEEIRRRVIEALKTVYDPEIPVNVYDLGLVYRVEVDDEGNVTVDMTLTSPGCPVAEMVLNMAEAAIMERLPDREVKVNLVWEPFWTPDKVNEEGRKKLEEIYGYDFVGEWLKRQRGGQVG